MEVIVLNIPERFRDSLQLRREDYQQINDGQVPSPIPKTWMMVFIACVAICLAGLLAFSWGYTTIGSAVSFSVPVSCTLYWFLKCLDWGSYFGYLSRICGCNCCRTAEIQTPELPSPTQPLLQPPTLQQPFPGPPTLQQPFPGPPTLQQPFPGPPTLQQPFPEPPTLQQLVPEPPALQQPVPEPPALQQPVPEPPALQQPVPELPALQQPVPELPALQKPVQELPALQQPVPEPPTLQQPVPEPSMEV